MSKPNPTVKQILREWLLAHGYDGLVSDDGECGCVYDDLSSCGEPCINCEAGYRWPEAQMPKDADRESDSDWYMRREPRPVAEGTVLP